MRIYLKRVKEQYSLKEVYIQCTYRYNEVYKDSIIQELYNKVVYLKDGSEKGVDKEWGSE